MNTLYKITGQMPLKAHLDKGILSLLHNIWSNDTNPVNTLIQRSSADKYNKGTWLEVAERTLKNYNLPSIVNLLELKCPDKENWKNFCKKEIKEKWETIIEKELLDLQCSALTGISKPNLNNKLMETITGAHTWTDLQGIKCMIQIMGDSLENNYRLMKCGKRISDRCTNCNDIETMIHAIYCRKYKDDYGVQSHEAVYNKILKGIIADEDKEALLGDTKEKLVIQLHPFDYCSKTTKKNLKKVKLSLYKGNISHRY